MDPAAPDRPTGDGRWWLAPLLKVAVVLAALAAAVAVIGLAARGIDTPSASRLIDQYGYLGIALGAFGDSFGLPSSGEIVLLLGSAAAAASTRSDFSLPLVIAVAWGFAVLGDACAYAIGRGAGPHLLRRVGVQEDSAVHGFMHRHGTRAVVAARMVAGIRTKVAIISGSTRMPFWRYVAADALGALVWAVAVGLLGYVFAESIDRLVSRFDNATGVVGGAIVVVVAAAAAFLSLRYVRSHHPDRRRAP